MKLSELKTEMDGGFAEVRTRFKEVEQRFEQVNQRFEEVDRRFDHVDQRFDHVDQRLDHVDQRFEQVDQRLDHVDRRFEQVDQQFAELRQLIQTEGEATRRHFDVVAEKMKDGNLVLDKSTATGQQLVALTASNAADHVTFERRLDDHERRLERIEKT